MSKKKTKIIIPKHGFNEHYLTWQIGNCSANTAHILGLIRFIILVIILKPIELKIKSKRKLFFAIK